MILEDLIKERLIDKIEHAIEDLEHDISFKNVSGNKWEVVVAFDLDHANEQERVILNSILKHL